MLSLFREKVLLLMLVGLGLCYSCTTEIEKPQKGSLVYQEAVSDFYVSLAAARADQMLFAVEKMDSVAIRFPNEAAAWANLAVFSMRQANFNSARERINKALKQAPNNADINFLAAIIESRSGNVNESVTYLREAAGLNPSDLIIAYALADELERQDDAANSEEIISILNSILENQPDNLAVLLELVRISVKTDDNSNLEKAMASLAEEAKKWPPEIQRQFDEISQAILEDPEANQTFQLAFLRNNLNQLPRFQSDLNKVQLSPTQVGFLITEFTWLPQPTTLAAPKDQQLTFSFDDLTEQSMLQLAKPISLSDQEVSDWIAVSNNTASINGSMELPFPGNSESLNGVISFDYNYDFMNDLAFVGSRGLMLYRQQEDSTFIEVTGSLNLPSSILQQSYTGGWARDIDLDGDLDLVMNPASGPVVVLRNNGDDTFDVSDVFSRISGIVNFVWADFDNDTDSDAAFLTDEGNIRLLLNERSGNFSEVTDLPAEGDIINIEASDIDSDGNLDLLTWNKEGVSRIYWDNQTGSWKQDQLVTVAEEIGELQPGTGSLYAADLDNNGGNDLMISSPDHTLYWLSDESLSFTGAANSMRGGILGLADFDGDTRLDLISLNEERQAIIGTNSGGKDYLARIIRPRASGSLGDRRINSFGIGGEIEIRSGLLYQKQLIQQPWVHLGLGTYDEAEVLRIIWPNGSSQAEFAELGYDSKIFNEQILKGSCPWVFTYNGKEMEFVTDFLWRTGLGIRINAQGEADVIHSVDWIKIGGDQLKPRDGYYDIRITADLWETHFFDHVSLMAIDHPQDTEVFVDERFSFPPAQPSLHTMEALNPVAKVTDQDGNDVTQKIRSLDREYVDSFELTKYQGIAEEHFVEVDLGETLPNNENIKLVASGWIYPTDTSVNIAISQGSQEAPYPIRLEVPDGNGGWKVARENIGFPAGKSKTMVIDLNGIFEPGTDHKVRLTTNMEIYWNQIRWGVELKDRDIKKKDLNFSEANLRYRGFSEVERPSRFVPELPNYQNISGTTPMWSDLEGFYTRFGPVNELVEEIDDRYVIMNAGDELVFKFPALDKPDEGWTRDFVLIGDGWVKDGDYNTGFSTTVLPLPYHGMEDYSDAPGALQDDPVFRKHKGDWINYHTRYITPKDFRSALIFDKQ